MGAMRTAATIKFAPMGHSIWLYSAFASGRFCLAPIRENIFLRPCYWWFPAHLRRKRALQPIEHWAIHEDLYRYTQPLKQSVDCTHCAWRKPADCGLRYVLHRGSERYCHFYGCTRTGIIIYIIWGRVALQKFIGCFTTVSSTWRDYNYVYALQYIHRTVVAIY